MSNFFLVIPLILGSEWAFSRLLTDGGPLPKIGYKYPTMIKLGTVILA